MCPKPDRVCLLLTQRSGLPLGPSIHDIIHTHLPEFSSEVTILINDDEKMDGPGWGLVKAFQDDKSCHWLVMPCDYPLMRTKDADHLIANYQEPVTCFVNGQGESEPLVSVWSPQALARLVGDSARSRDEISRLLQSMEGKQVHPLYDHSLFNTNTPDEWEAAMQILAGKKQAAVTHRPGSGGIERP